MGWENIDFKSYWFDFPKRGEDSINEFFAVRGGYLLSENGSCYMMPQQYANSFNSEFWVGILKDDKQLVHCMNPERSRVIEEDDTNPLVKFYLKERYPAFYSIETVKIIDIENENNETKKKITNLMQPQEMIDFCNDWARVLEQYEGEEFDVLICDDGRKLPKSEVIEYFSSTAKNMTEELERYNDAIKT